MDTLQKLDQFFMCFTCCSNVPKAAERATPHKLIIGIFDFILDFVFVFLVFFLKSYKEKRGRGSNVVIL